MRTGNSSRPEGRVGECSRPVAFDQEVLYLMYVHNLTRRPLITEALLSTIRYQQRASSSPTVIEQRSSYC